MRPTRREPYQRCRSALARRAILELPRGQRPAPLELTEHVAAERLVLRDERRVPSARAL